MDLIIKDFPPVFSLSAVATGQNSTMGKALQQSRDEGKTNTIKEMKMIAHPYLKIAGS